MSDADVAPTLLTDRTLAIGATSFLIGVITTIALWSTCVIPDLDPTQHKLDDEGEVHAPCEGALCLFQSISEAPDNLYRSKKARGKLIVYKTVDVAEFVLLLTTTLPVSVAGGFGVATVSVSGHAAYRFTKHRRRKETSA